MAGPRVRAAADRRDPHAGTYRRAGHLCDAYEIVAAAPDASGLTAPVEATRRRYRSWPYLVLHAERFAAALAGTLTDPLLPLTGAADQWSDSTDLIGHPAALRATVAALTGS